MKSNSKKTNTLKNNLNRFKLKWWYAVPVVLLVLIVGYFVVRFSQAGSRTLIKNSTNGLNGGTGRFRISDYPVSLVSATSNSPAVAFVGSLREFDLKNLNLRKNSPIAGKSVCAYVYGTTTSSGGTIPWSITVDKFSERSYDFPNATVLYGLVNTNIWPTNLKYVGKSRGTASVKNGKGLKCVRITNNGRTIYDRPYFAKVTIKPELNYAGSESTTTSTPAYNRGETAKKFGVAEVWVQ